MFTELQFSAVYWLFVFFFSFSVNTFSNYKERKRHPGLILAYVIITNWIKPHSKQQPLLLLEGISSEMQVMTYENPLFKNAKKCLSPSPVRGTP